ncbi:peptidoglycan-binding domain-containing protein [Paracoccus cavernae]|uniref:Peptidoglycan-binding domain-containing protein n=1 Tax=Paracoccus cavernae TaxID=1571207 RepID=A0ABT8D9K0_9RHOB|nr:peptidoglycan-binding domain-containing protein [Paracoccus cavernae]
MLRRGSKGDAVRRLQELLTGQGHVLGKVDGDFGERTDAAVRIFQKLEQLKPDGIVGAQTWAKLNKGQ